MELPALHSRELDTHKGDYGRIFVLAGSAGMVGAACLTARAAYRSGAGYVCLGLPWRLTFVVASNPEMECVLTAALPETDEGTLGLMAKNKIVQASESYNVLAAGPGLSQNPQTQEMLAKTLPDMHHALVLDADALNMLAKHTDIIKDLSRERGLPIFTPHAAEFARLTGKDKPIEEPQLREQGCRDYAKANDVVCVLKGHHTVVSDGDRVYVNNTGNPGMATAGTGDVLTGTIAALRGQGYDSFEAATLGVYLHGLAGDMVRDEIGEWGMNARDILHMLPKAFQSYFTKNNAAQTT